MLKKILRTKKLKKNKYSMPVHYQIDIKPIELNTNCTDLKNKAITVNKNQIKKLSDDFYFEMHAITNLTRPYLILAVVGIPLFSILSILVLFCYEIPKDSYPILSLFFGIVAMLIYIICSQENKKLILQSQSMRFNQEFSTVEEARIHWIKDRIGFNTDFFEYAEKLVKWKKYKESYTQGYKINWVLYIYDPQSKPRILALFIGLISLVTLIILNTVEVDPLSVLLGVGFFKFLMIDNIVPTLILVSFFFFMFWQMLMVWHSVLRFIIYITDHFNKSRISELRFSILLNFLLDYSDFIE